MSYSDDEYLLLEAEFIVAVEFYRLTIEDVREAGST